jgi:hypothetical protein
LHCSPTTRGPGIHYLVWYDADARRSVAEKIQDARAAYVRRFNLLPNLVLVNEVDAVQLADIEVRSERTVQPHTFWLGHRDERATNEEASADG